MYVSTQMPHLFRTLACRLLDIAEEDMRVIAPHVGGGFGGKAGITAEHAVAAGSGPAARPSGDVGRDDPRTSWLCRTAAPRCSTWRCFTRDGCITGLHASVVGDAGAYGGFGGGLSMGPTRNMAQGVYRIQKLAFDVAVAVTNTTPMKRSGGRPARGGGLPRAHHGSPPTSWTSTRSSPRRNLLRRRVPVHHPGRHRTTAVTTRFLDRAVEAAGYAICAPNGNDAGRPATAGSSASA